MNPTRLYHTYTLHNLYTLYSKGTLYNYSNPSAYICIYSWVMKREIYSVTHTNPIIYIISTPH